MKTIKPARNQVFARPSEAETKTKSGFILTEESALKSLTAEVINVGDAIDWIQPKDTIVYKSYTTNDIKLDGIDYVILAEEDIVGLVKEVD